MVGLLLFALNTLIWGTTWYAIEFQLGQVPHAWSVAYRFGLSSLMLFGLCFLRGKAITHAPRQHFLFAGIGACLFCFNYLLVYWATGYLTSGLVAVAFSSLSLFNLVNGRIWLGQSIRGPMVGGALLGASGLLLIFLPEVTGIDLSDTALFGFMLVLGAGLTASLGSTLLATDQARGLPVNAWSMAYGALIMSIFALMTEGMPVFDDRLSYWLSMAYLVIWGTVLSFTIYLALIDRIGLGPSGYLAVMTPLVALIVSTIFEDYVWTPLAIVGLGLILLGNVLIRTKRLARPTPLRG